MELLESYGGIASSYSITRYELYIPFGMTRQFEENYLNFHAGRGR